MCPMRNASEVRRSARDTLARVSATTNVWHESEPAVTAVEFADLLDGQPSHVTIKRPRHALVDQTEAYINEFRKERARTT
jgi:hypothetical protein